MMFDFAPFLTSSSSSHAFLASIALPLIISALRFAILRRRSGSQHIIENLKPRVSAANQRHETSIKGSASAAAGDDEPAPLYLSSSIDDEELIGGNPIHLSAPRGPTSTTLTFRVYTPPSFDKEIPKVDVYGAITFIRTGKVRTFVQTGARRLLVINFQEMTLGVYLPKQSHVKRRHGGSGKKGDAGLFVPPDDDDDGDNLSVRERGNRRSSGIVISTRNLNAHQQNNDSAEDGEESDEDWNAHMFQSKPALTIGLKDLVSVAAVPPRHGGVLEIMSRLERGGAVAPSKKDDPSKESDSNKSPKTKPSKQKGGSPGQVKKQGQSLQSTLHSSKRVGDDLGGSEYVTTEISNDDKIAHDSSGGSRRDEFAFRSPCDAAEFQRVIMALRTAGKEISHLYETLESIQTSPKIVDSADETHESEECSAHTSFASPGVRIDDAWHCLNEIPIFRKGLRQFHLLGRNNQEVDTNRNVILDAKFQQELAKQEQERNLLGLTDFFSLFVPPLPMEDARAIPSFMPCAKKEAIMFGGNSNNFSPARGIEWHYQRLSFVSALQRLVSRAAMFVRVYAWSRIISHDGWHCDGPKQVEGDESDVPNSQTEDQLANTDDSQQANGSSCDTDVQNADVGGGADGVVSDPIATSNSSCQNPSPSNIFHQGYSCVGWHAFQNPPLNKISSEQKHEDKTRRLCPESDPLDCIPSLQAKVKKYPHAHFFVYSHFNEDTSTAMYFLLVRSLPVGVDRAFDDTIHNFVSSDAEERDQRTGVALKFGSGNDSLMLTKVVFGALLIALRQQLSRPGLDLYSRIDSQIMMLSEFLNSIWHFGGSLHKRDNMPMNYVAVNSQFFLKHFPNTAGRWLLRTVRACIHKTSTINLTFVLKVFSSTLIPERAVTSIRIANIGLNSTYSVFKEAPEVKNGESRVDADHIQSKSGQSISAHQDELYPGDIDTILELLDGMTVPLRERDQMRGEHNQDNQSGIITSEKICLRLSRSDIERYLIACQCNLKSTVKRIVESESWRGLMFPVDTRQCQIEMQSGQFFQQGHDKEKNPIFYFRNMLLGPWRNDIHATALSILHRLETFFLKVEHRPRSVKITLIVLMGHPIVSDRSQGKAKKKGKDQAVGEDEQPTDTPPTQLTPSTFGSDPRIDPYEEFRPHSNYVLLQLLNDLIKQHYPERFAKVLIEPSKGQKKAHLLATFSLRSSKSSVTVLNPGDDLMQYVDEEELVTFAGGKAGITSDAFRSFGSYDCVGT